MLGMGVFLFGCSGDSVDGGSPSEGTDAGGSAGNAGFGGGDEDAGTGGAAAGAAGAGGVVVPDRGDPESFPTECLTTCEEGCAQLASCGGSDSLGFPLDEQGCLDRCELANRGHGPGAGNFLCCASQPECSDVKECGGWLANPEAVDACTRYCDCRMSSAMIALTTGHQAPEGYRFAPDALMLEPVASAQKLALPTGVRLDIDGKLKLVRLDGSSTSFTLAALRKSARVLPTFIDAAGRISAANGNLVVVADDPAALAAATQLAAHYGLGQPRTLRTHLRQRPSSTLTVLSGSDPWRTLDALTALSSLQGVHAELDQWRRYVKRYAPNDPLFKDQWHLKNTGQNGATVSVDGRVSEAWDVTMGDPQVIIAVNDDGVDLNHPDFAGKLEPELNYPDDWETQMAQGQFGGHGTSVAGVAAAASDDAKGGAGVCPDCRVLSHLFGDSSNQGFQVTDSEVAQGFTDIVDAGAWVINNSWGLDMGDPVYADAVGGVPALSSIVKAAFDYAEETGRGGLGTLVVFAAGNSNAALDPYTTHPTIIAVSAVDDLGLKPYYSSFGPEVDIAAPSNGGMNGITTTAAGSQYTADFGGTSSASPFISGVAGLVLSASPTMTAQAARDALTGTATKIDPVFGQWDQNGHSDFHGAGLVNAYAAVQLAAGGCSTPEECVAPSDDCGADCGTGMQCDTCRTHADCADGYRCQAMPSLGELVCVAEKGTDDCPGGTHEVNGYCLPTPTTCGLCGGVEECNGRDDDCNGEVDDGNVCQGGPMCFMDGPGCGTGMVCAGRNCTASCTTDADCSNGTCQALTNQYGEETGEKACMRSYGGGSFDCSPFCEARASVLKDEDLAAFTSCVTYSLACSDVVDCRDLLSPTTP